MSIHSKGQPPAREWQGTVELRQGWSGARVQVDPRVGAASWPRMARHGGVAPRIVWARVQVDPGVGAASWPRFFKRGGGESLCVR
mgnify:CR=1 FL=1